MLVPLPLLLASHVFDPHACLNRQRCRMTRFRAPVPRMSTTSRGDYRPRKTRKTPWAFPTQRSRCWDSLGTTSRNSTLPCFSKAPNGPPPCTTFQTGSATSELFGPWIVVDSRREGGWPLLLRLMVSFDVLVGCGGEEIGPRSRLCLGVCAPVFDVLLCWPSPAAVLMKIARTNLRK